LNGEDIQLLGKPDCLFNGFPGFHRESQNECSMNDDARLVTGFGEAAHFVGGHAFLDAREGFVVAAFIADEEQAQAVVFKTFDRVVIEVRAAVATQGQAEPAEFPGDLAGAMFLIWGKLSPRSQMFQFNPPREFNENKSAR